MTSKKVTVYTTNHCAFCVIIKDYLKSKNVEFEEKNVEENEDFASEMYQKSQQFGVPVIDIDGTIIIGADKNRVDAALA